MDALVMTAAGGSDRSRVEETDVPRPGPGEVTIDVAYAGVNFMDVMARRGDPGYATTWPYRPGLEVSGTVRELGAGVTGLRTGEQVAAYTAGAGFAEVALARAALTVPVPAGVELAAAAAAPVMLATAVSLLTGRGGCRPGDLVLVHSASGGVGAALAQLVPLFGGSAAIGTVGRPEKVPDALRLGYAAALARGPGLAESILRATRKRRVDLILDPQGTALLEVDLDVLAPGGRIVLFGNAAGGALAPMPPAGRLIGGNATVAGFSHRALAAAAPDRIREAIGASLELLASGELRVPVTTVDDLAEVPAVHQALADGQGSGKYVVRV